MTMTSLRCQDNSLSHATSVIMCGYGTRDRIRLRQGYRQSHSCVWENGVLKHFPARFAESDEDRRRIVLQHGQKQEEPLSGMSEALSRNGDQRAPYRTVFAEIREAGRPGALQDSP